MKRSSVAMTEGDGDSESSALDGEAATARASFAALSSDDAAKIVEFLQTLTRASTSN